MYTDNRPQPGKRGVAADGPVPADRRARVMRALATTADALGLALREAEAGALHWAALGLVTALQGALVAALSGYDTAELDAVLNASQPERIAPVALLLRRARAQEFLNPPERVELSRARERAVERVIDVRNDAVHALTSDLPETFIEDAGVVLDLLSHLIVNAPAFDARLAEDRPGEIARRIARLREVLAD
jgi:hypothetical protein